MNVRFPVAIIATLPLLSMSLFTAGCESSEGNSVEIKASRRDLSEKGQTSVLTASGWNDYKWTLSDKTIGRLDKDTGSTVVYTALSMPAANSAYKNQVVTCQTTDPGNGGGAFATITLRHVSQGGSATAASASNTASSGGSPATPDLVIEPTSKTIRSGGSFGLTVVSPPGHQYTWRVVDQGTSDGSSESSVEVGSASPTTGSSTTSRAPSTGQTGIVTITCTDKTTNKSASCMVRIN